MFHRITLLPLLLFLSLPPCASSRAETNRPFRVDSVAHAVRLSLTVPRSVYPRGVIGRVAVRVQNLSRQTLTVAPGCALQFDNPQVESLTPGGIIRYPPAVRPITPNPSPPCTGGTVGSGALKLACASVSVCSVAGFLGRLMGTTAGGVRWHDLIPAIFVSGTYGGRQPLHTYSSRFTATAPWRVAVGTLPGPLGPKARLRAVGCSATKTVDIYVRNAQRQVVAGPILIHKPDRVDRTTVPATGKLRLDAVAHCGGFSVRVDGVGPAQG